jgi:hypothetical protein
MFPFVVFAGLEANVGRESEHSQFQMVILRNNFCEYHASQHIDIMTG